MSTQTKASSGGGRNKGGSSKSSNAAVSAQAETNNNNASAKKQHNDQPKTEKDKPHVKVSILQLMYCNCKILFSELNSVALEEDDFSSHKIYCYFSAY